MQPGKNTPLKLQYALYAYLNNHLVKLYSKNPIYQYIVISEVNFTPPAKSNYDKKRALEKNHRKDNSNVRCANIYFAYLIGHHYFT